MKRLFNCIKNLFKIAKILSVNDSGDFQFANVSFLGKSQKIMLFTPYGIISHPPHGSMSLLWSQQGQESNGIGIADDPKTRPIRNLAEGEVALVNHFTGDYVYLKENGDMEGSVSGNLDITVAGDADMVVGGDVQVIAGGGITADATTVIDLISPAVNIKTDAFNVTNGTGGATSSNFNGGAAFVGGTVTHNGTSIDDSHVHSEVQTGPSNTGVPV